MNTMFNTLLAAAAKVETPVDGHTGVWVKSGTVTVSSAMTMQGVEVTSGQRVFVYSRGRFTAPSLASGVSTFAYGGGSVVAPTLAVGASAWIYSGASLMGGFNQGLIYVSSGGYASGVVEEGTAADPNFNVVPGGSADDLTVGSRGRFAVQGVLSGVVRSAGATYCYVLSGGTAYNVTTYNGWLAISSGGYVSGYYIRRANSNYYQNFDVGARVDDLHIESGTTARIQSAAVVSLVELAAGATLVVSSGGTALAVTSNAGAVVTVLNGGYIEYA